MDQCRWETENGGKSPKIISKQHERGEKRRDVGCEVEGGGGELRRGEGEGVGDRTQYEE